ncbi:uncharacterized protein LOC105223520 [Bactrocera dorsalis]|uniref:Uncharacterized protein LOC105223520 n=1 Tax=Bactrocera dorsalis TaxID=27457 RepID=A0ABM3J0P4_BACDO|nr:uncharacterized protein LOC105223520 [Bactrocera dorsalis]
MVVEKFCCFSLESTAKFFGVWGMIGAVLEIVIDIFIIAHANEVSAFFQKCGLNISESDIQLLYIIYIVLALNSAAGSFCLLSGASEKRHNLVLVWLICSALGIVTSIILIFFTGLYSGLIGYAFSTYLWIAMYALYKRIKWEGQTGFSLPAEDVPKQMA